MFILFALIVMRMSGAVVFNSIFGRSGVPGQVRGAFILVLSLMYYVWLGGTMENPPGTLLEFAVMLLKELMLGFALGFGMEINFMIVRFAGSIIDFAMGLSMAQVFDPQSNTQVTVTSNLYNTLFMLMIFTTNAHLRYLEILFTSAGNIPFGQVQITAQLAQYILQYFCQCIVVGLQLCFPMMGLQLLTEVAIGLLMKAVPQVNIFAVNFQIKLIIGMAMLLILYNPVAEKIQSFVGGELFDTLYHIVGLMAP